ncbi:sulfurtransferase [Evansella tamaricis]|uniref:Sulfurtransferase n=1 Tax=Evansella tamaricis TaxID=2069301 RepID=A0ABS6JEX8_9BACI|nr:sulfurtransferase [Evansella tamaricis]MBU9711774.1 sulfurtransferase [Evansella tamaricis]
MVHKNTISSEWLNNHLNDSNLIIVDCRFQLGQPTKGYKAFQEEHLPRAIYLDLEKDLSSPISQHGGRHPLPTVEKMVKTFSKAGIDQSKKVVIYDDQGGAMAARLWWMLKYLGHEQVFVLEEGFSHWKANGYPTSSQFSPTPETVFIPSVRKEMLVSMEEVRSKINDPDTLLIDSRSKERYTGEQEPIDPVAGHIPGAVLEDWQNRLSVNGTWKTKPLQRDSLQKYIDSEKDIIIYCGSGVTACANVLAFDEVGLKPRLYAGSWSDWITYQDNPIARSK